MPARHVQGVESNVKHHRRFSPILWPENRANDAFVHYPHGGRLDGRWRRGDNYNDSVTVPIPDGYSYDSYTAETVNKPHYLDANPPSMPFSHLLNYDYFLEHGLHGRFA